MADTLKLSIITPEGVSFSEAVDLVTLPGIDGELGVLPLHTPLMTQIVTGEVQVQDGPQRKRLAVGEGFAVVLPEHVVLLTDLAVMADDEAQMRAALAQAEARRQERLASDESARVEAALAHALTQVKGKRRPRA